MSLLAGKSRLLVAAVGMVVAAGYLAAATQLATPLFSDPVGPRMVPYLIAAGLCLSCLCLVAEQLVVNGGLRAARADDAEERPTGVALLTVVLLLAYYLIFERLGFVISTALFLIVFLSFTNRRRRAVNAAVAVLFPVIVYVILDTLLGARLPPGILRFG